MYLVHTIDIKLASILLTAGVPHRKSDPITCQVETLTGKRHEQFTFWFEVNDEQKKIAQDLMNAFWKFKDSGDFLLPSEHPLYYMLSALENRETLLNWIRTKVEPIKSVPVNDKITILLSERARPALKEKLKQMARGMV